MTDTQQKYEEIVDMYPNLASAALGAKIVYATDEWFAAAENMVADAPPVWKPEAFSAYGKWMDGWESRRRRTEGHDWCIVELAMPGFVYAIEVDTAYFTGNNSPRVRVQGVCYSPGHEVCERLKGLRDVSVTGREEGRMGMCASEEETALVGQLASEAWVDLVPLAKLGSGHEETRRNYFLVSCAEKFSHLRVNMGPDGGIARVRVHGQVALDKSAFSSSVETDLGAVQVGGLAIAWSDKHYGHPRNMIAPGRGNCMGDGWETARQANRPAFYTRQADGLMHLPGCDWSILKLGLAGALKRVIVDTNFFQGNYPESFLLEGCNEASADKERLTGDEVKWSVLIPRTRVGPSKEHPFEIAEQSQVEITHVRLTIYPDGGVMRLRLLGNPV